LGSNNAALLAMLTSTPNVLDNTELTDQLTWAFNSGSEHFNYLAVGQSLVLTYTITVTDSQAATDTQTIVLTINGTNDAPVISIESGDSANQSLAINGLALQTSGTLSVTDLDRTDIVTAAVTGFTKLGDTLGLTRDDAQLQAMLSVGGLVLDDTQQQGPLHWAFDSVDYAFDYLGQDESLTLIYSLTVTDSQGTIAEQDVTLVIEGRNSAPEISLGHDDSASSEIWETDSTLQTQGTLSVLDLNTTDVVVAAVTGLGVAGTTTGLQSTHGDLLNMLTVNSPVIDATRETGTLAWGFNSGVEAFDYLAVGESLTLTYTLTVTDSRGTSDQQDVTITIWGTNDVPQLAVGPLQIEENSADGTSVGSVVGSDLDRSDVLTYSLLDTAGGRFGIQSATGEIFVADGGGLDYETATSHSILVRVSDTPGAFADLWVTIEVINVNEAPQFFGQTDYQTDYLTTLRLPTPGLLLGAWDPEGDVMTARVIQAPHSGAIWVAADGELIYWPEVHFEGRVEFVVEISDGLLVTPVVYRVDVARPILLPPNFSLPLPNGPPRAEVLVGELVDRVVERSAVGVAESVVGLVPSSVDELVASVGQPGAGTASVPSEAVPAEVEGGEAAASGTGVATIRSAVKDGTRVESERVPAVSTYRWQQRELGSTGAWSLAASGARETELGPGDGYEIDFRRLADWSDREVDRYFAAQVGGEAVAWTSPLTAHAELMVGVGATTAWLLFHGRILAVAAASTALREAVDPTRVLEAIAELRK
jgi:VCBS repeat-containing protein